MFKKKKIASKITFKKFGLLFQTRPKTNVQIDSFFYSDVATPENGFKEVSHTLVNGSMSFGCLDGFHLTKAAVVWRCEQSGTWSGGAEIPGLVGIELY